MANLQMLFQKPAWRLLEGMFEPAMAHAGGWTGPVFLEALSRRHCGKRAVLGAKDKDHDKTSLDGKDGCL
jgi:hypothetical protein